MSKQYAGSNRYCIAGYYMQSYYRIASVLLCKTIVPEEGIMLRPCVVSLKCIIPYA